MTTATVNAVDNVPSFIKNNAIVIARVGDSNQFAAYSKITGKWIVHTFPKDVKVVPIVGTNVAIFRIEGDSITELAAVDERGNWSLQKLPDGTTGKFNPMVSNDIAIVTIGKTSYAFSGIRGSWASIDAPTTPKISDDTAMIVDNDKISMFSAQSGRWSVSPKLSISQ